MTEPQPRPLDEAVTYRSRRQTELQKRALRHNDGPLLPKAPSYLIVGHVARVNNPHFRVHFAIAPTLATYFAPGGVLVHAPTFGVLAAH